MGLKKKYVCVVWIADVVVVEDAPYRRSKKVEDNNNKWEQEQELVDHWTAGSGLMLCM